MRIGACGERASLAWLRSGDETSVQGDGHDLDAAVRPELAFDVSDMDGGGLLADEEGFGDLTVGSTGGEQLKDFALTRRQIEPAA